MSTRIFSIGLFCLSLMFLIPGLILPMITIKASVDKSEMLELGTRSLFYDDENSVVTRFANSMLEQLNVQGEIDVFEKTRSVIGTIHDLISSGHSVVGVMIGSFAVVIPVFKVLLLCASALLKSSRAKNIMHKLSANISKWSMADVFVMAILVGYMATNASTSSHDTVRMDAELGTGFYFFMAYCVVSVLASQLLEISFTKPSQD